MKSYLLRGARRPRPALWSALLATTVLSGIAGVHGARAADNPSGDKANVVEEVVVTAEKRSESLQKVSASIQALDSRHLEQLNVTDFGDYSKYLPALSVQTLGPSDTQIYMRGVASGEDGNHSGPLPSVGAYLDELPITTIAGTLDIHIYDVQRIEALAGPQGTLYGASSEAGTLRIITNKPVIGQFSAAYDVQASDLAHGGLGYVAEGYANLPINDKMAVRIVGWDEHDSGYIDSIPGSRTFPTSGATVTNAPFVKNDFNQVDTIGARGQMKIDLDDNWTITPALIAQHAHSDGVFGYDTDLSRPLSVQAFGPDYSRDTWYQASLTVQGKVANYDITYAGGYFWRKLETLSDYMDYSYAYDACCGYGAYWVGSDGVTPLANPRQAIFGHDVFSKDSHELRIASPSTDRFRFVGGLFYERQTHWIIQDYQIDGFDPYYSVPNWPQTLWLTDQMRIDRDEAAYGQFDFDLTDHISLTGGIRFYEYRNTLEGFYGYSANFEQFFGGPGFFGPTGQPDCSSTAVYRGGPGCIDLDKVSKGSGETHRVTATYKFDPDHLIYATYSTGYRPGGVNRNGDLGPYQPDYLTNYEIGWKTSWFDHRLIWNGAIYQEDWNNFQFSYLGQYSLTVIENAASARIRGAESNLVWAATDHLTINASGAYNDAQITKPYCADQTITCTNAVADAPSGQALPVTPKFKGNATARYTWEMGDWNDHFQAGVVYQGASWPDLRTYERSLEGQLPAYTTADFSLGTERNGMTIELFLKNAFDSRGNISRYTECTISVCGQVATYAVPIVPRMIGLKFGQKF